MKMADITLEKFWEDDYLSEMSEYPEDDLLDTLKEFSLSEQKKDEVILWAASFGYMKIVDYYIDDEKLANKEFVNTLLSWTAEFEEFDSKNFIYLLNKINPNDLEFTKEFDSIPNLLNLIMQNCDFENLLNILYEKRNFYFSEDEFKAILKSDIDYYDERLERLFVLCKNQFFKNISDDLREDILKEIIEILKVEYYVYKFSYFNHEDYSIFLDYLKSMNLTFETLHLINIFCTDSDYYNDMFINCTEDSLILAWDNCKELVDGDFDINFLYNASAFGCIKLLEKLKEYIQPHMISDLLYFAISREYGHKISLKTAAYLIKEFGINNFKLTSDILEAIKSNNLSKVLLALLKNKENLSDIDWKEWFKDVNEFSDIIETYCSDVIFSIMHYEYQILLMELMEERKGYVDVQLSDKCANFKEVAVDYGYNF